MARIIRLDTAWRPARAKAGEQTGCDHRWVTAWRHTRTVSCDLCGAVLDPFAVLVDMLQTLPPEAGGDEEKRFLQEMEKRGKREPHPTNRRTEE